MPRHNYVAERSNDHPDPGMRPGLDALRSKLRGISLLENKPEAVEWLIKDMAWHFFTREAKRPHALERLIASFHLYASSASIQPDSEIEPISVTTEDASSSRSLGQVVVGGSPDLNDKGLMKRVRELIQLHTYEAYEGGSPECGCGEQFDLLELWAVHVRKLIWKELRA